MTVKKIYLFTLLAIICCFGNACKKDLLHFSKVIKIDSHTSDDRLSRILFTNNHIGYVVGGQRFYHCIILTTTDGGNTFSYASYPDAGKCLYGITVAPSGTIYSVAFDGKLLSSTNGTDWRYKQMPYLPFADIAFPDALHGIGVGGVSFESGFLLYIDSAGNTIKYDSLAYQLNRIKMTNSSIGYISGYGVMLKTTDGGQSWNVMDVNNDNFTGLDVHSPTDIWSCGYGGGIFHTINGGTNWQRVRNGNDITLPAYHLYDVLFLNGDTNGWAVGENGVVIHSDDGGAHWMEYDRFTKEALRSIAQCPNGDLLVAGDNGALYRLVSQ